VQGQDLQVSGLSEGPYPPGVPVTFDVSWSLPEPLPEGGEAFGVIVLGPPGAESAVQLPVRLHNDPAGLETVTLPAAGDARIFAGIPTDLYGSFKHLYVGANATSRSVLRFDLSAIDPGSTVAKATLRLYLEAFGGGGSPADLAAYRLTTAWTEAGVNWNAPWANKGGDFVEPAVTAKVSKADLGRFVDLDVTPWAQAWAQDPSSNRGLIVRLINQTSFTYYRLPSGEYWDPSQAPRLDVVYSKP
jgi:hypothetical protein